MVRVHRWSVLGIGVCAALALVTGCGSGGGIGGIGQGAAPATTTTAGGGVGCAAAKPVSCLMPRPDGATVPTGSDWAADGTLTKSAYLDWSSTDADERDRETTELAGDSFSSAGYRHWENDRGVQAEVALVGFANTAGATRWIDYDNRFFADTDSFQKLSEPSIPGVYVFTDNTANDDGTYTTLAIGRFGTIVMEFYSYASSDNDPVARNQLASWAAVQAGILKRAS